MGGEVKLIGGWASPFSHRVECALKLKGVKYEFIDEDLSNKSPLLLKSNPIHHKIPVLIHNNKPICESLLILQYIDETWPHNPLLPPGPYDKAIARFWANFVDDKIVATASKFRKATAEEKELKLEEIGENLRVVEAELKGKKFCGGESIGYVDIAAFFIVYWLLTHQRVMEIELITKDKFPIISGWMKIMQEIDAVKECLPPLEKHFAYIRARIGSAK